MPPPVQAGNAGGSIPIFYPSSSDLQKGYTGMLYKNWQIRFNMAGDTHTIKLNNLSNTSATITISSTPQIVTLKIGEEKKMSITNESYYDLFIKLNSISGNRANITIKSLYEIIESIPASVDNGGNDKEQIQETNSNIWIYIFSIILILAIVLFFVVNKRKK